jgi:hypothetical protein
MTIEQRISEVKRSIPNHVLLVAVSKTKPVETIKETYDCGQRHFGENKVQEMVDKYHELPKDIQWHLIGHLQTNKVKYIAPFVSLVHSIDSLKLLLEVDKQAKKQNRVIKCLLQFHIAEEETKFGFSEAEAEELLNSNLFKTTTNVKIVGVMGMASFTEDQDQIRSEFIHLRDIFTRLKNKHFENNPDFREISMGMSGDFQIAIEEGSTMVRVGSSIFGER